MFGGRGEEVVMTRLEPPVIRGEEARGADPEEDEQGRDDDFAKGETPYNRIQGDSANPWPNPCLPSPARPHP